MELSKMNSLFSETDSIWQNPKDRWPVLCTRYPSWSRFPAARRLSPWRATPRVPAPPWPCVCSPWTTPVHRPSPAWPPPVTTSIPPCPVSCCSKTECINQSVCYGFFKLQETDGDLDPGKDTCSRNGCSNDQRLVSLKPFTFKKLYPNLIPQ